ncbi:MAG: ribosome small subunit-dependent GTPase A [Candidatus Izemoplasmataceae bacterium]
MKEGKVIKLVGGRYDVLDAQGEVYTVVPRGVLRHQGVSPKVGDRVTFDQSQIIDVLERDNDFVRPPIANVDQVLIVTSTVHPDFSTYLLDRFLILAEDSGVHAHIVLNKIDLVDGKTLDSIRDTLEYYRTYYPVHCLSIHDSNSMDQFKKVFKDKESVLAGQSGAGKSSILNAVDSSLTLRTAEVSKALGRGRHTTRHVELLRVEGGLVADTPGFSKLSLTHLDTVRLKECYKDFETYADACKFRQCLHVNEPGCAVKAAVEAGKIPTHRYETYKRIHEEINTKKRQY